VSKLENYREAANFS